jgi:hypothetical protein
MRNVLHGPLPEKWSGISDAAHVWRKLPYALLLASLLIFGCFPRLLTEKITPDAEKIVNPATSKVNEIAFLNFSKDVSVFRPHPSPLSQERENRSLVHDTTTDGERFSDFGANQSGQRPSPLPEGEGRGEGERINTSKESQSRLTSAATEPK